MVNKLTSPELIIKPIQFVEEAVEGVVPATPTFVAVGVNSSISIKKDGQWVEVAQLAMEDLAGLVQGPQKFSLQIKYNPVNSTFLKYGINSANYGTPAGTISKSLTLMFSIYLNGAENFIVISGLRPNQTQIDGEVGKPIQITMDCVAVSVALPTPTGPVGGVYVSTPPAGPVWDWLSGGSNPVSDGGTAQDTKKFTITVNRNVKEEWTMGNLNPFGTLPHGRRIAFSGDFLWDSQSTFESDNSTGTAKTMALVLKSALSTITLSTAYVTNYTRDSDIGSSQAIVESITGKALTIAVT